MGLRMGLRPWYGYARAAFALAWSALWILSNWRWRLMARRSTFTTRLSIIAMWWTSCADVGRFLWNRSRKCPWARCWFLARMACRRGFAMRLRNGSFVLSMLP